MGSPNQLHQSFCEFRWLRCYFFTGATWIARPKTLTNGPQGAQPQGSQGWYRKSQSSERSLKSGSLWDRISLRYILFTLFYTWNVMKCQVLLFLGWGFVTFRDVSWRLGVRQGAWTGEASSRSSRIRRQCRAQNSQSRSLDRLISMWIPMNSRSSRYSRIRVEKRSEAMLQGQDFAKAEKRVKRVVTKKMNQDVRLPGRNWGRPCSILSNWETESTEKRNFPGFALPQNHQIPTAYCTYSVYRYCTHSNHLHSRCYALLWFIYLLFTDYIYTCLFIYSSSWRARWWERERQKGRS